MPTSSNARELKFLRTRLGRIIRDIRRKIEGNTALEDRFGPLLDLALRVRHQEQRQRGPKVYSLHAPEVECIGRGKARAPYEFGCKVSIATPITAPKGGQFVLHAKALHGNPYDGHTLGPVIADLEKLTGVTVRRIHGDKGYRGHNYPNRFKVWISGQVRRVTKAIRREMRRRAAIEPVIGHLKEDHRMRRNYLTGRHGDRINAVLAAAGYNFSLLLRWFEELLRVLSLILCHALLAAPLHLTRCRKTFFTADDLDLALDRAPEWHATAKAYFAQAGVLHQHTDLGLRHAMLEPRAETVERVGAHRSCARDRR